MGSRFYRGQDKARARLLAEAYYTGRKEGSRNASGFVVQNDLLMIYASIIIALHEKGWSDEEVHGMISHIQESAQRHFAEGWSYQDFLDKAEEMTGITLIFKDE